MSDSRFQQAVQEFNRQAFFDCHETLEAVWTALPEGEEKIFYQGLLQVAVGFYHWQQGNRRGTVNLLSRGLAKLEALPPSTAYQARIHLMPFIAEVRQCLDSVKTSESLSNCKFPKIKIP